MLALLTFGYVSDLQHNGTNGLFPAAIMEQLQIKLNTTYLAIMSLQKSSVFVNFLISLHFKFNIEEELLIYTLFNFKSMVNDFLKGGILLLFIIFFIVYLNYARK